LLENCIRSISKVRKFCTKREVLHSFIWLAQLSCMSLIDDFVACASAFVYMSSVVISLELGYLQVNKFNFFRSEVHNRGLSYITPHTVRSLVCWMALLVQLSVRELSLRC